MFNKKPIEVYKFDLEEYLLELVSGSIQDSENARTFFGIHPEYFDNNTNIKRAKYSNTCIKSLA